MKKIKSKIAAALSISLFCAGILPVSAEEFEIPQAPMSDEPVSAECVLINSGELMAINSGDLLNAAEPEASDVTIDVRILDEYEIPGFVNESIDDFLEVDNEQSDLLENSSSTTENSESPLDENNETTESDASGKYYNESRNESARAALPDVTVSNLRHDKNKEPLPVLVEIPFQFQVENVGNETAPSSILEIFFDNKSKGKTALPSIAPGTGFNLEVGVGCKVPGKWEIKLQVNTPKQFNESNYDNNTYARSFQWSDGPIPDTGLVLQSFYLQDNQPVFQQNVKKTFLMDVANTSSRNFSNIPIQIDLLTLGGSVVSSNTIQLPKLSAQEVRHEAGFQMSIARRGGYILRATVLAPSGYTDPDTSDNSAEIGLTVTYGSNVNYCKHFRNGKFPNGSSLDIYMTDSVTVVTPQQIATAASYWNGITDQISYRSLSTTSQKPIYISEYSYRIPGYEKAIAVADTFPRNNATVFEGANIKLSKDWFDQFGDKGKWTKEYRKMACVAHELGHVLGLAHAAYPDASDPEKENPCGYTSLMASAVNDTNYSADLEEHDMFNLYYRYA